VWCVKKIFCGGKNGKLVGMKLSTAVNAVEGRKELNE